MRPDKDDSRLHVEKVLPVDEANAWERSWWRWLSTSWLDRLVSRYGKLAGGAIEAVDLGQLGRLRASDAHVRLHQEWSQELRAKGPSQASLGRAVYRVIGLRACALIVFCAWTSALLEFVGLAMALETVLRFVDSDDVGFNPLVMALVTVGLVFVLPLLHRCCSIVVSMFDGYYTGLICAGFGSIVLEKSLRLPLGSGYKATEGRSTSEESPDASGGRKDDPQAQPSLAQLVSADIVQEWAFTLKSLALLSAAPLVLACLVSLLYWHLHAVGLLSTLYLIPGVLLSWLVVRWAMQNRRKYQTCQDQRLRLVGEVAAQISSVKALGWEPLFRGRIRDAREGELGANQAYALAESLLVANMHSVTWFLALGSLWLHLLAEGSVEARHLWIVLQLMASLQTCLSLTTAGLRRAAALPTSLRRLESYLRQPERPASVVREPTQRPGAPVVQVCGSFAFEEGGAPVLHNLDLAFFKGELVAVLGHTASGKSALAHAILGELYPAGLAHVVAPSQVAYCSQEPWVLEGSLQEAVVAGQKPDEERCRAALEAAALAPEGSSPPPADCEQDAVAAHRGCRNLRVRAALARAAYADAELVVLDDPLGPLSEAEGEHVFEHLFLGQQMRDRTRVLITQPDNRGRLGRFDRVVLLDAGRVVAEGAPEVVMASRWFQRLWTGVRDAEEEAQVPSPWPPPARPARDGCKVEAAPSASAHLAAATAREPEGESQDRCEWASVAAWLREGGPMLVVGAVFLALLQRLAQLWESLALAQWSDEAARGPCNHRVFLLSIFAVVLLNCFLLLLGGWIGSSFAKHAASEFHDRALASVLRTPVDRFFDKQPVGRIINRFSFDMMQVDGAAAGLVLTLLRIVCGTLFQQVYILSLVPPWAALATLPLYAAIAFFGYLYRGTVVSLAHYAKVHLSTTQELAGAASAGNVSIRANGLCPQVLARYRASLHNALKANYLLSVACKAWVSLRVTLCLCAVAVSFALYAVLSPKAMGVGTLGLVISFSFAFMSDFELTLDLFAQSVVVFSSLQRVAEYFHLPQEAPGHRSGDEPLRLWASVARRDVAAMQLREGTTDAPLTLLATLGDAALQVGAPLLEASSDGRLLKCAAGQTLGGLAPSCAALRAAGDRYCLAAAGAALRSAKGMAEEFLRRGDDPLQLDLWHLAAVEGVRVQLEALCAGYAGRPDVLRNVGVDIAPRERSLLVGPAGSGKSTVLRCLLRLLEPRGGRVLLGGREVSCWGLESLRCAVGLVPQEPTVFVGSWRENMDPWGRCPDARVWDALRSVGLLPQVRLRAKGLDGPVATGAVRLSAGQRRLLSLARAVVHQPPLLLVDECAASLDPVAQESVQATLLADFPLSTLLAVTGRPEALRLHAASGFDRVLRLESGRLVQAAAGAGHGWPNALSPGTGP